MMLVVFHLCYCVV